MNIRVAISDHFLKAYNRLPKNHQHQVSTFINQFKRNPTATGINYEVVQGAPDKKIRSVRINGSYRAIVLQPSQGNMYALLWVDNHDEAYAWACTRRADIHPETGSLQIITTTEHVQNALPTEETVQKKGLFADFKDKDLIRLGIPEALMPVVHQLSTEQGLEKALEFFPEEAGEALVALAAGYSIEEVYAQRESAQMGQPNENTDAVDTEDFDKALDNPDTLRRFVIIDNDQDLEELLDKPLEKWRIFLHPSQRKIVQAQVNGSIRVLGGAGTGKTVVAMHRAKWLAEQLDKSTGRILFTTFTKNLAVDIRSNLAKICSNEQMRRIEIINLDSWVQQFLQKQGYEFKLTFQGQNARNKAKECWQEALSNRSQEVNLSEAFYRDEWEQIISAQGITEMRDYFKVSRKGRGTALDRNTRKKIWLVFQEYRLLLQKNGLREVEDAYRDARQMLENKPGILAYQHVLVDETQDMGEQALKLVRQIVPPGPNDLFLVGDAHQRIYNRKVVLKNCGINILGRNHSFRLKINYRTTDEIRRWAVSLLEKCTIDDLDEGKDSSEGYHSLMFGEKPRISRHKDFGAETDYLVQEINQLLKSIPDSHICIVARTKEMVNDYAQALERNGLITHTILPQESDNNSRPGIRMATMHRVKGLEFDAVFVAGANASKLPLESALVDSSDAIELENAETRERSLLYVAATRARKILYISCYGSPSRFIESYTQV
jgi:superfamily I DNA/RNA helicase/mRNA-degrading endonuclease RelE of RelBE toxin-antitoxin system